MPKIRFIKPETWTDEKFVALSPLARLMFMGMWSYACDNGHLDDSAIQLKMRLLPADDCNAAALLEELISSGLVVRGAGYVKVVNLANHQKPDLRFLVFCDHCEHDEHTKYAPGDRKERTSRARSAPSERTTSAHGAPNEGPTRARRNGDGDGDGDGECGGAGTNAATPSRRRKPQTAIPEGWKPTSAHAEQALAKGVSLSTEALSFRNHAESHDRRCADWNAAFRNWLMKATPERRPSSDDPYAHLPAPKDWDAIRAERDAEKARLREAGQ